MYKVGDSARVLKGQGASGGVGVAIQTLASSGEDLLGHEWQPYYPDKSFKVATHGHLCHLCLGWRIQTLSLCLLLKADLEISNAFVFASFALLAPFYTRRDF